MRSPPTTRTRSLRCDAGYESTRVVMTGTPVGLGKYFVKNCGAKKLTAVGPEITDENDRVLVAECGTHKGYPTATSTPSPSNEESGSASIEPDSEDSPATTPNSATGDCGSLPETSTARGIASIAAVGADCATARALTATSLDRCSRLPSSRCSYQSWSCRTRVVNDGLDVRGTCTDSGKRVTWVTSP